MFDSVEKFYKIMKKNGVIRVYTKSIYDNYYFDHKRINSFEYIVKNNHWEKGLLITFLNLKDVKKLFSKFKKVQIGIETFNYINHKRNHSYWVVTGIK